jgi:hypothetical protein
MQMTARVSWDEVFSSAPSDVARTRKEQVDAARI